MHEVISLLTEWLLQYGGPILFVMLVLAIVALPIPGETFLVLSGCFIAKGKLEGLPILIFAIAGTICGITLSYLLGRYTGNWLLVTVGPKLRITDSKIQKAQNWYLRMGKWILLIGYFIPVVRHLSGFMAGTSKLNVRDFMIYAYTGAIIWSSLFLALGYFLLIKIKLP